MGRFAVVLPLDPLAPGDAFPVSAWPLHVTVVEPFETPRTGASVARLIDPALDGFSSASAETFDRAMFGPRRDVPVSLVRDDGTLAAMRMRVLGALREADVDVAHARLHYRPHITDSSGGSVPPGRSFTLSQVALVDLRPLEGPAMRTISAVWHLPSVEP